MGVDVRSSGGVSAALGRAAGESGLLALQVACGLSGTHGFAGTQVPPDDRRRRVPRADSRPHGKAPAAGARGDVLERVCLTARGHGVVTLDRPSNVDDAVQPEALVAALRRITERLPLVWPVHPHACAARRAATGWQGLGRSAAPAHRVARLPRLPRDHGRRPPAALRLGRQPGGDHCARPAGPHLAYDHGAAGHRVRRDVRSGVESQG